MEPLPQTRQVLAMLAEVGGSDLEDDLWAAAERITAIVPSCVGVSLTIAQDVTLTFVSTSARAASIDLAQGSGIGPCVESAREVEERSAPDLLDEDRWRRFADTAAAEGVRASLSLPLLDHSGAVAASFNLYASEPHAFDPVIEDLRALVGPLAGEVTTNADLSFTSRDRAEGGADELERRSVVAQAVGCLMALHALPSQDAQILLETEAEHAGVDLLSAARAVLDSIDERRDA